MKAHRKCRTCGTRFRRTFQSRNRKFCSPKCRKSIVLNKLLKAKHLRPKIRKIAPNTIPYLSTDMIRQIAGKYGNRLTVIENRIRRLRKEFVKVYNRYYAKTVRRVSSEKRKTVQIARWAKRLEKADGAMKHLALAASKVKKGKMIMMLDRAEYCKLRYLLKK